MITYPEKFSVEISQLPENVDLLLKGPTPIWMTGDRPANHHTGNGPGTFPTAGAECEVMTRDLLLTQPVHKKA